MSLSKQLPSKLSRGSHLSFSDSKAVALELGSLIENAERDVQNRIKLNPIMEQVEKLLGAPCKINHFVEYSDLLITKLSCYMRLKQHQIYATKGNKGTWVVPQLAVLCICYFWDEFKIHASDVYHRYITNDVSLACEIADNAANSGSDDDSLQVIKNTLLVIKDELRETMQMQLTDFKSEMEEAIRKELVDLKNHILESLRGVGTAQAPPSYTPDENKVRGMFAETKAVIIAEMEENKKQMVNQFQTIAIETQMKTIANVRQCVCDDVLPLLENSPANNSQGLKYTFAHVKTALESDAIEGATDFNFRVEWKGFSSALAGELFSKMKHRTQADAKILAKSAFNVDVQFGSSKLWSSISLVALIQKCVLFRIRWWRCQKQNLRYPNPLIAKLIERSTYMNVGDLYSILMYIQQALSLETQESLSTINDMISTLQYHFPEMEFISEIGDAIDVRFGVIGKQSPLRPIAENQSRIDTYFRAGNVADENDEDLSEDEPLTINRSKRHRHANTEM